MECARSRGGSWAVPPARGPSEPDRKSRHREPILRISFERSFISRRRHAISRRDRMKVLINITTVFIAMIVLAAVFRQVGRSSLRNWLCSTASAAESASTKSTEAEWVPVRDASLVIPANSSIDFSGLWPSHPAGASGRVMARDSQDDRLAENISKLRLAAVISLKTRHPPPQSTPTPLSLRRGWLKVNIHAR